VNITKLDPEDIAGDDLTGGYIIKIDKVEGTDTQGWYSTFVPYPGAWQRIYYQYDEPDQDDIVPQQKTYIQNYILNFESMMFGPGYADPQNGYASCIDVDSFVDYFILNEISRNVDGYRLSSYMYKDRDSKGGKLTMGPAWDFNLAFGNADYYNGSGIAGWQVDFQAGSDGYQIPFWWRRLLQDSSFTQRIYSRWQTLRTTVLALPRLYALIDSVAQEIDEAQARNFQRWPVLGQYVWPNNYVGQTYADELNYLKDWVNLRVLWMDARIPGQPTGIEEEESAVPVNFVLEQNYPNPFNPTTIIPFHLRQQGRAVLKIYDTAGHEVATLTDRVLPAGRHEATFDASPFAGGVYFCQLTFEGFSARKKLLFLK